MLDRPTSIARREFLRFLAASPYVAAAGGLGAFLRLPLASAQQALQGADVIADPASALNVFDFEEAAHRKVPPGHWAYMASGVDDDATLRANREIFKHVQLRPRRLHDATLVDTRVELFGTVYNSPIFLCPTGGERSFHADGELAVARAAPARHAAVPLDDDVDADRRGQQGARPARWYQLYAPSKWAACEQLLRRVEAAGSKVVLLTVDNTTGRNSETYRRTRPKDLSQCVSCHGPGEPPGGLDTRAMFKGIDMTGVRAPSPAMDWAFVDQLRKFWRGTLDYQGDRHARGRASGHGSRVRWDLLSNHGGRATETLRSTLEALPEVVAEAGNRIPVFVDGGFRRGTEFSKRWPWARRPLAWAAVSVGPRRLRSGGRRSRARDPARRAEARDGKLRHADRGGHQPLRRDDARLEAV